MNPRTVSREEWLVARRALLAKEKELSRRRDELGQQRRALPSVRIEKTYAFTGPKGRETLPTLFAGRSQLVVYHFMFAPDWDVGCKSCSFWADHFDAMTAHLNARDVTFAVVSRAPLAKLAAFARRMGWKFTWLSSADSDFNFDFGVSFAPEAGNPPEPTYNYQPKTGPMAELPGLSVFLKDDTGAVFHTYSCFARGLDILNGTYNVLDLVPKGRDEAGLPFTMSWVRFHDEYGTTVPG